MVFLPINKTLLVHPIKEKGIPENSRVLLPEEMMPKEPFTACIVEAVATDCEKVFQPINGIRDVMVVLVRTEGLEKVKYHEQEFTIVSEKFIVGEIRRDLPK